MKKLNKDSVELSLDIMRAEIEVYMFNHLLDEFRYDIVDIIDKYKEEIMKGGAYGAADD